MRNYFRDYFVLLGFVAATLRSCSEDDSLKHKTRERAFVALSPSFIVGSPCKRSEFKSQAQRHDMTGSFRLDNLGGEFEKIASRPFRIVEDVVGGILIVRVDIG